MKGGQHKKQNTNLKFCGTNLCVIALTLCIFAGIFAYIFWHLCKNCTNAIKRKKATQMLDFVARICVICVFCVGPPII